MTSFKYLGETLCKDGTRSAEIHSRIASAMAAMAKLNRIWWHNTISFASKFKLHKSLVTPIFYGCETWTLLADCEKKDPGFQNQVTEETSPHLLLGAQDQRLGVEQDQLPCGSTGTSSCNCQEMEICSVGMSHATTASPKPSLGNLRGWATPWSAEEMLGGQHERVDISDHAKTVHKRFLRKRLEEDLC